VKLLYTSRYGPNIGDMASLCNQGLCSKKPSSALNGRYGNDTYFKGAVEVGSSAGKGVLS
jgi:hypothetical protein